MDAANPRRTVTIPMGVVGPDEKRKRRCSRVTEAFHKRAEGSERRWLAGLGADSGSPIRCGVLADVRAGRQPLKETVEGLLARGDPELYRVKAGS